MIKLLQKYFAVEEVRGDNYNDITVLMAACSSMNELAALWERLKNEGKFNNLTRTETIKIVNFKNLLKKRFLNIKQYHND